MLDFYALKYLNSSPITFLASLGMYFRSGIKTSLILSSHLYIIVIRAFAMLIASVRLKIFQFSVKDFA